MPYCLSFPFVPKKRPFKDFVYDCGTLWNLTSHDTN